MPLTFTRLLRTPHSERHLIRRDDAEIGALDIHYLDHAVQATLVLLDGPQYDHGTVASILTEIDEVLLPEVRLDKGNLSFTVVVGRVLGDFHADPTVTQV